MLRRSALSVTALVARVGAARTAAPGLISAVTPPPQSVACWLASRRLWESGLSRGFSGEAKEKGEKEEQGD
eukprot:CAMPEP_0177787960 /NCGR_PEP_ID=MMETSP0491_2-20121128/21824_1 /TAXON_ID=63592 /ORGANISM="Tetraselmis chuii, Strain PLY429" /LENGTH=70 /DNA_ID=CAMNT_0019309451 /DNA_START=140 /DNA_END=349 /DNA_ORIENTATION=-